ncbi:hypothetical protein DRE_03843 [Drechslerella stenobrocha 248]|uniref:HhH-GPD domain-containing protein n=1 Tax=Drechslerella stenobrocha 248 TaxID=1043628 RepID=W7HRY7_9PEZI|nr:hypothetical protein DRE_03843 [Drechslerella stenobrocha 248]
MSRRLRSATKQASAAAELPSNALLVNQTPDDSTPSIANPRKRKQPAKAADDVATRAKSKPRPSKQPKSIALGQSPYPSHPFPTPSECHLVHSLLTKAHGPAIRPAVVPTASTVHAGCGEVPSVLDALMRTILSANTSAANSSRAFKGLLTTYGVDETHGGIDWEAVRVGGLEKLYAAIQRGGLANIKSRAMKDILDEVHDDGDGKQLSLDYLHGRSDDEAMRVLMGFKGVGVKTATCVMMFCLRRELFPVDTHVFRISKLLGWVPTPGYQREVMERESKQSPLEVDGEDEEAAKPREKQQKRLPTVTRDTAFLHLDASVPPELKYGLHQLMIRHGRYCPACSAAGGRKYGIGQNGKPLVSKLKRVTVKEEQDDGSFAETQVEVVVKEEAADSDHEGGDGSGSLAGITRNGLRDGGVRVKVEGEEGLASELEGKPYVPVDAAGGTGERTGGNPDGSCILGELVSWERLM